MKKGIEDNFIENQASKCLHGDLEECDFLFDMAGFLHTQHKELPSNIWVSVKNEQANPRIVIQRNKGERLEIDDTFGITISDSPSMIGDSGSVLSAQDIDYFKDFIRRNKDTLMMYWNGDLDTADLTDRLAF